MLFFFLLELANIGSTLFFVYYSKNAVDISLGAKEGNLREVLFAVVGFVLLGIVLRITSQWLNQQTLIRMQQRLQYHLLKKQMISTWKVIRKWDTGDILVRLNTDGNEVVQMVSTTWINILLTLIKLMASFLFLFTLDRFLAIIILCITPLFFLSKIYFARMKKLNEAVKSSESGLGILMQENLRYRVVLRSLGILGKRLEAFADKQRQFSGLRFKQLQFSLFSQTGMRTALSVGYLLAFIWGVLRLQEGNITYGTMTAFLQLVNQVQSPILTLGAFVPAIVRFRVAVQRIYELNSVEVLPEQKGVQFDRVDAIEFDRVSFRYDEEDIIKELSMKVERGDRVALMGASGRGKTTLIRLLLGLLSPNTGNIRIVGDGTTQVLSHQHIDNFAYVPQGNTLLRGSIRDNIMAGHEEVGEDRLREVIWKSCAEFVYDLPQGLDTVIGESGVGLSEGQAQRIAIARAILDEKKVWLLDEATSALDLATTKEILIRLKSTMDDKIVIFVTHDKNVSSFCNKQILLN